MTPVPLPLKSLFLNNKLSLSQHTVGPENTVKQRTGFRNTFPVSKS